VDSAHGNIHYLGLAKEKGLCAIPKLRTSPAIYFNHGGKGKTRPKKHGDKVDINKLPEK